MENAVAIGNFSQAFTNSIAIGDGAVSRFEGDCQVGTHLFGVEIPSDIRQAIIDHPEAFAWFGGVLGEFVARSAVEGHVKLPKLPLGDFDGALVGYRAGGWDNFGIRSLQRNDNTPMRSCV